MKPIVRTLVLSGIGVAVVGGVVLFKGQWSGAQKELGSETKVNHPDSRQAPAPTGTFEVKIVRSQLPQDPVYGLSDKGDVLLQSGGKQGEFDLYAVDGKPTHIHTIVPKVRVHLRSNGTVIHLAEERATSGQSQTSMPYNESADRPRFFGDGTMAVVRKHNGLTNPDEKGRFKGDFFTLTKEVQEPVNADAVAKPKTGNPQVAGIPQGYVNKVTKSEELYATDNYLYLLNTDEKDSVWVSEGQSRKAGSPEKLNKFTGTTKEEVPMPQGYENAQRIAITDGKIVGTFGILNGKQPFRAFTLNDKSWKELPIPNGFDCSFAQTIFNDGVILGYVTSWDGKKMKHVLWKGESVAVLDDLEGWPKNGALTLVNRFNRVGDIVVRSITDLETSTGDTYVLKL